MIDPILSLQKELSKIIAKEGINTTLESPKHLKKDNSDKCNFSSSEIVKLDYKLLRKDKTETELEIFRINVES